MPRTEFSTVPQLRDKKARGIIRDKNIKITVNLIISTLKMSKI